jgi:ABC-2 type transport system permease protein
MRRLAALAAVALALLGGLSGCGSTGITAARVQHSVAATFANLWVLQQSQEGHPHPSPAALHSSAACQQSGSVWVCNVVWLVDGPSTPATAIYDLNMRTNGCYTADGNGPLAVNEQRTMTTQKGSAINPLWEFDSCFDTT